MNKELIKRLRSNFPTTQAQWEAADRIEQLERELERLNKIKSRTKQVKLMQERDALLADNARLREALQTFIDEHEECSDADDWAAMLCSIEAHHVADEALATTPEQALTKLQNHVREECEIARDELERQSAK